MVLPMFFKFEYYTKEVFISISVREALGQKSGKCSKCPIREPDARVRPAGQQKKTRGS